MAYIGQAPSTIVSENTFDEFNFTATSNQTTFTGVDADGKTLVYNPGNLEVFLNGVRLEEADFTATNGTSVVLSTGATTGDVMSVKSFTVFEVSDTVSKASGGAFGGNISVTGTVTATSYSGDGSSLSGISTDLVGDITPQLGGNLDLNSKNITGTGDIDITGVININQSMGTTVFKTSVAANSTVGFEINKTGSTTQSWRIVDGQTINGNLQFYDVTDNRVSMQIDGTGALLVGKHAANFSTAGTEINASGRVFITYDGGGPLQLNRLTSFGDIIELHKDGAEVGAIGSPYGNELYIEGTGANSSGLLFTSGNSIQPRKNNASDDGNIDIGTSGNRFKDLHLSNRIKLGASGGIEFGHATSTVGSASSTLLDHYEEGTWTPILTGYSGGTTQTYAIQSGNYIRIGRQVIANFSVRLSSKGNISGNYVHIKGLPYNHQGSYAGSCTFNYVISLNNARDNLMMEMGGSTPDRGWITYMDGTSTSYMNTSDINNGTGFQGTIVYYTS